MSTEQRLRDALEATQTYSPSPDLWQRVVHSIEEDRRHRRRVLATAVGVAVIVVILAAVAWLNTESAPSGARVDWRVMEGMEVLALTLLIVALGPAIRRFGRSFAGDLFLSQSTTGDRLLSLLDLAYYLVFAGYVLMSTRLAPPAAFAQFEVSSQIREASMRVAGLLLSMGTLHALALWSLPMIAFVFNSTRTGRQLPRWVVVVLVAAAIGSAAALPAIFALGLGE